MEVGLQLRSFVVKIQGPLKCYFIREKTRSLSKYMHGLRVKVCYANGRCAGKRDPERITYFRADLVTEVVVFSEFFRSCI